MTPGQPRIVVIGASAGAVQTLSQILPALPADFPLPILIVVHVPADRTNFLAPLFQAKCRMIVREADDKEPAKAGTVYFAPPDYHLLLEADGSLSLSNEEAVQHSRPSIDVLFESAADAFGPDVIGIILTGANSDGAQGLLAIAEAGGMAIIEDPASAYADAMPLAAQKACATAQTLSLEAMTRFLLEYAQP
jgi:two-component system chemotaxis response regulator CheB